MLKINDHVKCPQCNARSRVIWVSQDGLRVAIHCERPHSQLVRGPSTFGSTERAPSKPQRNLVFIVETAEIPSARVTE
jgi:hypothetical protein